MIKKLRVQGFRILKEFEWEPSDAVNILVGANSAGKSTVLDAIELVTKGSLNGARAANSLAPDWFNSEMVSEFFSKIHEGETPEIPRITISVVFADTPEMAAIRGCNGPLGAKEDAPGLFLEVSLTEGLKAEFLAEVHSILENDYDRIIPTEYYSCEWKSYKGEKLLRRPPCIISTRIDTRPEQHSRAVDSFAKRLLESELADGDIREISRQIRKARSEIDSKILSSVTVQKTKEGKKLGLQLDRSPRSDWKNSVVLERNGLPFAALGSADQIQSKCSIAIERASQESIMLIEEPECHLSHTSLRELLSLIETSLSKGQQAFVTTHSPYVLNRLGLNSMSMIVRGNSPKRIASVSDDTVRYFKKLSGFDTLRIVLAEKVVLVEGPTDEMVFNWAFNQLRGCSPEDRAIDVVEYGTRYKRALELAAAIDKEPVAALRDNDNKPIEHWKEAVKSFESDRRQLLVGHESQGRTIETQMIKANLDNLPSLAKAVEAPSSDDKELEDFLLEHKAEWSLRLLEADKSLTDSLLPPGYIQEAVDFIDPVNGENEQ